MPSIDDLKSRIADDLVRSDLNTQIVNEIYDGITKFQRRRFWFNETRDETFSTVAGQYIYGYDDLSTIPDFVAIDALYSTVSSYVRQLRAVPPEELETLGGTNAMTGEPTSWCYFAQSIRLYPVPNGVYSMRIQGHIRKTPPTNVTDSAYNVWTYEAFELLRCYAKRQIAMHTLRDMEMVAIMNDAVKSQINDLLAETSKRNGTGIIRPTQF